MNQDTSESVTLERIEVGSIQTKKCLLQLNGYFANNTSSVLQSDMKTDRS